MEHVHHAGHSQAGKLAELYRRIATQTMSADTIFIPFRHCAASCPQNKAELRKKTSAACSDLFTAAITAFEFEQQ